MTGEITELSFIDPEAVHLVGHAANGFEAAILAKAAAEVGEVQRAHEQRSQRQPERKKKQMGQLKKLRKAEAARATAPVSAETALRLMKAAADDAQRQGDTAKAEGLRREVAVLKLQIAERQRQERGRTTSRLGPNSVEIFKRVGTLPEDTGVHGL